MIRIFISLICLSCHCRVLGIYFGFYVDCYSGWCWSGPLNWSLVRWCWFLDWERCSVVPLWIFDFISTNLAFFFAFCYLEHPQVTITIIKNLNKHRKQRDSILFFCDWRSKIFLWTVLKHLVELGLDPEIFSIQGYNFNN